MALLTEGEGDTTREGSGTTGAAAASAYALCISASFSSGTSQGLGTFVGLFVSFQRAGPGKICESVVRRGGCVDGRVDVDDDQDVCPDGVTDGLDGSLGVSVPAARLAVPAWP